MFERFTDRARRVVVLAQEEARAVGSSYVGTEHLLLGLITEGEAIPAQVCGTLGITDALVRAKIEELKPRQRGVSSSGHIPFTDRAKRVVELSLREGLQLGHNYIAPEHMLLALVREGTGIATQTIVLLGHDLADVRQKVIEIVCKQIPRPKPKKIEATSQTRWSELPTIWKDAAVEAVVNSGNGDVSMAAVAVIACALWDVASALSNPELSAAPDPSRPVSVGPVTNERCDA